MPRDGDWRLAYDGVDLLFGDEQPYMVTAPPDLGEPEITTQDTAAVAADGALFGRDTRGGRTIVLELGVNEHDEASALAAHSRLAAAWRGDRVRATPQRVAELYVQRAGRQRVVFGRPRKFASTLQMVPSTGYAAATAEFACADDVFYDGVETVQVLDMVPPSSGGFTFPVTFPWSTVAAATRPGQVSTGGDVDTWPVIEFTGPITNPSLTVTGVWTFALAATLAYDEVVTVDPRPWVRSILRSDGGNLAAAVTRASVRLPDARLPAGRDTQVVFSGTDTTGTATCTVRFRSAWAHL